MRTVHSLKMECGAYSDQIRTLQVENPKISFVWLGVILRDSHGVAQVRLLTGNKILRILKAKGSSALRRQPADRHVIYGYLPSFRPGSEPP